MHEPPEHPPEPARSTAPDPSAAAASELLAAVSEVVLRNAPDRASLASAGPDAPLPEHGFDSLGVVRLLVDLEETLGVTFPSDAVTAETFGSIRTIAAALKASGAAPAAPPAG
ncbi:acyl carrier protein [Streptomyces sp. MOE7]|uniref:acyl carrier protein n=1 Tax=Streptomyces sp. MOE7 TaxID=1961713 RepID=UPI0013140E63|nr:acyl carrier protein [Streptomyces sp. MOE7]